MSFAPRAYPSEMHAKNVTVQLWMRLSTARKRELAWKGRKRGRGEVREETTNEEGRVKREENRIFPDDRRSNDEGRFVLINNR